jgi:haloalkane dehalogenase
MNALRTPDSRFANLPDYSFAPHWHELRSGLRLHYVDEGPRDAPAVLMLHGEPSWSYLYRKMIPVVAGAGLRAIAPDLVGFGKSDKPRRMADYSYQSHMDWLREWVEALDLKRLTLFCQD